MTRVFYLAYAGIAYAIFLVVFLYLIAFTGNLPGAPLTVDRGPESAPSVALAVNLALIALFSLQHSVMARPAFKAAWTRLVPQPIERATFVMMTNLVLVILFLGWHPIPAPVWTVTDPTGAALLWGLFGLGWVIVLVSTFLINHFELFGLQQAWLAAKARGEARPVLRQPLFYKLVRHPLYAGFFLAFWATPTMSFGHLLLASGMSVYMLIAIQLEERNLIDTFGADYLAYRETTPMLVPGTGGARPRG